MSKLRKFTLMAGMDLSITLVIDTDILDDGFAAEIAGFWSSKDDVMDASGGDPYQAVARYAAPWLWASLLDGDSPASAIKQLHEQEGWCIPGDTLGIAIASYEIPDMDAAYLDVQEEQP